MAALAFGAGLAVGLVAGVLGAAALVWALYVLMVSGPR